MNKKYQTWREHHTRHFALVVDLPNNMLCATIEL